MLLTGVGGSGGATPTPALANLLLGLDDTVAAKFLTTSGGSTVAGTGDPVGRWNPPSWAPSRYGLQATAGQRCVRGSVGVTSDTGKWLDLSVPVPLTGAFSTYCVVVLSDASNQMTASGPAGYATLEFYQPATSIFAGTDAGLSLFTSVAAWTSILSVVRWRRDSGNDVYLKYQGGAEQFVGNLPGTITLTELMARPDAGQWQTSDVITRAVLMYSADCGATGFAATEAWTNTVYGVVA
jgi:hypothetical protein